MTPNITDIAMPARGALLAGMEGISAINTLQSVMGINLDTLRPEPCVEGYSTLGGYSSKAVKPIALAKCMQVSRVIQDEFDGARSLSGIGGVEKGSDAAEFILLGASTVQVRQKNQQEPVYWYTPIDWFLLRHWTAHQHCLPVSRALGICCHGCRG
jgi:dihydropyrimidine dehydrogenase (NADP+)